MILPRSTNDIPEQRFFLPGPHLPTAIWMVSTYEVLSQLTLPNLKKIAKRLGIHVKQGISGYIASQAGMEIRRPYIQALDNSNLVSVQEIDRILGTRYSKLEETYEVPGESPARAERRPQRPLDRPAREEVSDEFQSSESILRHLLDRYLYKEDVQEICFELGLPGGGTKEDLEFRLLGEPRFQPEMAVAYVAKEGLKEFCDELGLSTSGTREDLEGRIFQTIRKRGGGRAPPAPSSYAYQPGMPPVAPPQGYVPTSRPEQQPQGSGAVPRREPFATQDTQSQAPLEFPEVPPPGLIPEPVAPQIAQLQMVSEFLEKYQPSQRFRNEQSYEIEVAQSMRHHFGNENVKTQANIPGGRIDIEVLGIGVEIKVPTSRGQLQTLLGQVSIYRNYYGANLVILVFNDLAKYQDVNEFANILRGRGIQVFVK